MASGDYERGKEAGWKEALGIFEKLYGIDMGQGTKEAIDGISQQNNRRNHAVCRAGQEVQREAVGGQQAQVRQNIQTEACMYQGKERGMPEVQTHGTGQNTKGEPKKIMLNAPIDLIVAENKADPLFQEDEGKGEPEEVSSLVLGYLRRLAGPYKNAPVVHPKFWKLSTAMSDAGYRLAKEIQECQFSEGQAQSLMLLDMLHSFDEQVARKAAKAFLQETSEPEEIEDDNE